MARPLSNRHPKLTAEERRLIREQEDLKRREAQLQRELKTLPARIEERKSRERELAKLRSMAAAPAISLGGARGPRAGRSSAKGRRLPVRELQNARIKSLVLILILATFVILLWRAIPG
jgi:septal ring factor EnvC (AmiA/AmiB activator)